MRSYTESWNYTLSGVSQPYYINNGSPSFSAGFYRAPLNTYINRSTVNNYSGNYALTFKLRINSAGTNAMFGSLRYNASTYVPMIQKVSGGVRLGWGFYNSALATGITSGDWNGRYIYETGEYTVVFLKRNISAGYSQTAAHITTPSGLKYHSEWYNGSDFYGNRNQLGNNVSGSSGYFEVGQLSVLDQLTSQEADTVRLLGEFIPTPTISPATSNQGSPVTVSISKHVDTPVDWVLRYTTDGSEPNSGTPEVPAGLTMFHATPPTKANFGLDSNNYGSIVNHNGTYYITVGSVICVLDPVTFTTTPLTVDNGAVATMKLVSTGTKLCGVGADSALYEIDTTTGDVILRIDDTGNSNYLLNAVFHNGVLYVCSYYPMSLYSVDTDTWTLTYIGDIISGDAATSPKLLSYGGNLYFSEYYYGVFLIDPSTAAIISQISGASGTIAWIEYQSKLYRSSEYDYQLYEFDIDTGVDTPVSIPAQYGYGIEIDTKLIASSSGATGEGNDIRLKELAYVTTYVPALPGSTEYSVPFTVGDPFTAGTSVTVKAALFDALGVSQSSDTAVYTFVLSAPLTTIGGSHTDDVVITWTNEGSDPTKVIVYTKDGSDPETSLTSIVFASGQVFAFNSYPENNTPATAKWNYIKARRHDTVNDTWSEMTTVNLLFSIATPIITPDSGVGFGNDVAMSISTTSPTTVADVTINAGSAVEYPLPATVNVPFSVEQTTVTVVVRTNDGILTRDSVVKLYSFQTSAPVLSTGESFVSGVDVAVEAVTETFGAVMYYSLDKSVPDSNSNLYTGPVTVQVGATLRVVALYQGRYSNVSNSEILPEYEVSDVATSYYGDAVGHYYVSHQRVELTEMLHAGLEEVLIASNTTPDKLSVNFDGELASVSLWDTGGNVKQNLMPVNSFTGLLLLDSSKHECWSRFVFTEVEVHFLITLSTLVRTWFTADAFEKFKVVCNSRYSSVVFKFRSDSLMLNSVIVEAWYIPHVGAPSLLSSVSTGSIGDLDFVVSISANEITLTRDITTLNVTLVGLDVGTTWDIATVMNPSELQAPAESTSIPCVITTTSTEVALLRRAPGSVYCTRSQVDTFGTTTLDFAIPENALKLKHGVLQYQWGTYQYMLKPCDIGYSAKVKGVACPEALFDIQYPDSVNAGLDFEVSTVFDCRTQPDLYRGSSQTPESLTLCLLPTVGTALGTTDTGSYFVRLRYVLDNTNKTTLYLETPDTTVALATHYRTRSVKFTLRKLGASLIYSAVIDGVEIALGSSSVVPTGYVTAHLKLSGTTDYIKPREPVILREYVCSGTTRSVVCNNPVLVGANFKYRGQASGFNSTILVVPNNSVRAVWFDATTNSVTLSEPSFEPSDGRLLVGIIESQVGVAFWTNTMYSKLIRKSLEVNGIVTGGSILGIGSQLKVSGNILEWVESGNKRTLDLTDVHWKTPLSTVDLKTNTYKVRSKTKQVVNVTVSTRDHV